MEFPQVLQVYLIRINKQPKRIYYMKNIIITQFKIRGAFNKFPDFFVQAFKIMLLLYIL